MAAAAESMFTKAAMLPRVELTRPSRAIGTNTIDAMKSGIIFGYVGLVEGMVTRIQREMGARAKVVATGGLARLIAKDTRLIDEVNPELTLIGLKLIYGLNRA
jgi:type III pantothenate kinase